MYDLLNLTTDSVCGCHSSISRFELNCPRSYYAMECRVETALNGCALARWGTVTLIAAGHQIVPFNYYYISAFRTPRYSASIFSALSTFMLFQRCRRENTKAQRCQSNVHIFFLIAAAVRSSDKHTFGKHFLCVFVDARWKGAGRRISGVTIANTIIHYANNYNFLLLY